MAVKNNPSKKLSEFEENGKNGLGKFTLLENGKARIRFEDEPKDYLFEVENLPEFYPTKPGREWDIKATLNKNGDKVNYITPATGDFTFKFQRFSGDEEKPPVAKVKQSTKGDGGTYLETHALMEVVKGGWKGAILVFRLYPKWLAKDEDGNMEVIGEGTSPDRWRDFFKVTGITSHPDFIPFSENMLPEIQKMAQEIKKEFKGVIVRGWLDTVYENIPLDEDEDYPEKKEEIPEALKD